MNATIYRLGDYCRSLNQQNISARGIIDPAWQRKFQHALNAHAHQQLQSDTRSAFARVNKCPVCYRPLEKIRWPSLG